MNLSEPLVTALVQLLNNDLNTNITALNATVTDGYTVPLVQQILPFVPVPSTLQGGMPAVGIQRLKADFEDDIVFDVDAVHTYAVVAIVQNADQQTLAWELERILQAIAYTIQQDRVKGQAGSTLYQVGGAWNVMFLSTEPGPLLADLDPTSPESPPRAYLSWTALLMESKRKEVNASG